MGLHVLSDEDLLYQVKICKSLMITPILTVYSLHQLRRAASLSLNQSSIISIDDMDLATMTYSRAPQHRAIEWLQDAEVKASLKEKGEEGAEGGPPLIMVEGRKITGEERKALEAVGVGGSVVSYAQLKSKSTSIRSGPPVPV